MAKRPNSRHDAIVVGAGPNGLAAAITLARAGCSVRLIEGRETLGGAVRSAPLTLPGFIHDVGASAFPFGRSSPFFKSLPLAQHGLTWIDSPAPLAHALDGSAVLLERSVADTAAGLGRDGPAWRRLFERLAADSE